MSQSKIDGGLSQRLFQNRPILASFLSSKVRIVICRVIQSWGPLMTKNPLQASFYFAPSVGSTTVVPVMVVCSNHKGFIWLHQTVRPLIVGTWGLMTHDWFTALYAWFNGPQQYYLYLALLWGRAAETTCHGSNSSPAYGSEPILKPQNAALTTNAFPIKTNRSHRSWWEIATNWGGRTVLRFSGLHAHV